VNSVQRVADSGQKKKSKIKEQKSKLQIKMQKEKTEDIK
jgi:hypothetical protein